MSKRRIFAFRASDRILAAVRELARKEDRTPSEMARLILERDAAVQAIIAKQEVQWFADAVSEYNDATEEHRQVLRRETQKKGTNYE